MVFTSLILRYFEKPITRSKKFIDALRISVTGGAGGMGLPKFNGLGGNGGNVILEASTKITLRNVLQKYLHKSIKASCGQDSHTRCIYARSGKDHIIQIPTGITVMNDYGHIIGELNREGETLIVARGGPGGCEETGYSGMKGQHQSITLYLKLIADVGLVGFPNAGKSTFLKAITKAKPKIASYPFTTLHPNIGIVEYPDLRKISIADLPGLIEGAHKNIGMGHWFLRHVERTKLLLFVVDINGFQLSNQYTFRSCLDTVVLLNKEIELYKEYLLDKPAVILINKMDLEGAWNKYDEIKDLLKNMHDVIQDYPEEVRPRRPITFDYIMPISAKTSKKDIDEVKEMMREYLDVYSDAGFEDAESSLISELKRKIEWGPKLV